MSQGQCLLGCPPLPGSYRAGHAASPHPAPDGLPAPLTRSGHVVRVANMRSVYYCCCPRTVNISSVSFTFKNLTHLHDDVIKWEHLRVAGPLCAEFTGNRLIPPTKTSDAEL